MRKHQGKKVSGLRHLLDTPGAGLRLKMKPCVLEGVDTTQAEDGVESDAASNN